MKPSNAIILFVALFLLIAALYTINNQSEKKTSAIHQSDGNDSIAAVKRFKSNFCKSQFTVVIAYSNECKMCKAYIATIKQLNEQSLFNSPWSLCILDPGLGGKTISDLDKLFFFDKDLILCNLYGITTYPSCLVIDNWHDSLIYSGKIDDRAVSLGVMKTVATKHYLRDVLQSIMKGQTVTERSNLAIGCCIGKVNLINKN